jgi:hypothetical protein
MVHIYLQKFLLIGMSTVKIPVYLYNSRQKGDLPPDSDLGTSSVPNTVQGNAVGVGSCAGQGMIRHLE